jgi:hypothetical protein
MPASPTRANALPESDRLVPNTTIPEERDCAKVISGAMTNAAVQIATSHRMTDPDRDSVLVMTSLLVNDPGTP